MNPHNGSTFDSWLDEEGIRAECEAEAQRRHFTRKPVATGCSKTLLATLSVPEFMALRTTTERNAYAARFGLGPVSQLELEQVKRVFVSRQDNARLGIADPWKTQQAREVGA